jgi:hypothetical protein
MVGLPSNQFHHSAFSAPRLYTPVPHTAALPIKWVIGMLSSSFRMEAQDDFLGSSGSQEYESSLHTKQQAQK